MASQPVMDNATAEVIRANTTIMTVPEAQKLERQHASQTQYYAVYLVDDRNEMIVRVRTPIYELDEHRNPVVVDGEKVARNVHDVALNVWAAYGADDYTLLMVMRGPQVVATPQSIANELAMTRNISGQG